MSETESDIWSKFKTFMGGTVIETINEIHRLMPDSILFGSILLYFLTQNIAFGVFSVFIFETVLSHKLVSWMTSQTVGSSRSTMDIKCHTGYRTPRFDVHRMFLHESYPSYGVFSITSIGTYLGLAMSEFSKTLNVMGPEWASRSKVAYALITTVVIAFAIVRWYSCDNISEIIIAAVLALITGVLFFYINRAIFGEEAMNFLGLPYLVGKDSQGSPIYVCAAEKNDEDSTSA
jgi:hypothetical protein